MVKRSTLYCGALLLALQAGCSGAQSSNDAAKEGQPVSGEYKGGPVELILQDNNSGITDWEFQKLFLEGVQAKYPQISIKLVKGGKIEEMIAAGETPDLVAVSNPVFYAYEALDYPQELEAMIKSYNVNLNSIDPVIVDELRRLSKDKKIYGLPFGMNVGAMMYNKDLFDLFGVPYPKDRLTWEEHFQLTKQLTRTDGGGNLFFGSAIPSVSNALKQYGVSSVNAEGFAVYSLDGHKAVFSHFEQYFQLPGFVQGKTVSPGTFFSKQNVAMFPNWINGIASNLEKSPPSFKWGMTSFPVFANNPSRGNPVDFHLLLVSKHSKNKEAAYQVVLTLLSEQVQLTSNRNGRPTILNDMKIKTTYSENSGVFKDVHLEPIFKVSSVPNPYYSVYNAEILAGINSIRDRIALERVDINTAAREAEEKTNKAIRDRQAQEGKN